MGYPSRVNYGNGDTFCGAMGDTDEEKKTNLLGEGEAVFRFSHIGNKNDQELKRGGDMNIIEKDIGDGYQCLFFANDGKDIYPSLQGCQSYSMEEKENCPWDNYKLGLPYCGFTANGMDPKEALLDNGDGDWEGLGKAYALMNNKQAVFILTFMQAVEEAIA